MEIKWIKHKGKKILYVDHRGAKDEKETIEELKKAEVLQAKSKGNVCALGNVEGVHLSDKYLEELEAMEAKHDKGAVGKFALVGMKGIKRLLLNGYLHATGDKRMKCFDKEEDAKEWLAEKEIEIESKKP